jgi:hypothetical protein
MLSINAIINILKYIEHDELAPFLKAIYFKYKREIMDNFYDYIRSHPYTLQFLEIEYQNKLEKAQAHIDPKIRLFDEMNNLKSINNEMEADIDDIKKFISDLAK